MLHNTPSKMWNLLTVEYERRRGATVLRGRPYKYIIDVCNYCNLRCPLCPTGEETLARNQRMMKLDEYLGILEQIKPYALEVSFHNWGESTFNRDLPAMIRATQDANVGTNLSSNWVDVKPELIDNLIQSGLEYLVISCDGASKETYDRYRYRGDFDRVIENMRALVERKRRLGSATPFVEWQFLVFKHNYHEIEKGRALAEDVGVNVFRPGSAGLPIDEIENIELAEKWLSEDPAYGRLSTYKFRERGYLVDDGCFYPFRAMTINPDGGVSPCCSVSDEKTDFGNIFKQSLADVWNNEMYRSARALFSETADPEVHTTCDGCNIFKKSGAQYQGNKPLALPPAKAA
ncbi:MAG: radical SAM protein [Candidatus Methylomirabilis sp.]|nr:radical SAM protein [Deltaproteobacteria bacterium]